MRKIDDTFISYASDVLADTNKGLTGSQIIKHCNKYAIDFDIVIPIGSPDFGKFGSKVPNKRTALYNNLLAFSELQQFQIIKELCELEQFETNGQVKELKQKLYKRYDNLRKQSGVYSSPDSNLLKDTITEKENDMESKSGFIQNYIYKLEKSLSGYNFADPQQMKDAENNLFDLILEVRNVFAKEFPEIEDAILLRKGTGSRDANSVIGILKLHLINNSIKPETSKAEEVVAKSHVLSNKVFIVHGHDNEAKLEVARFIEKAGMQAVILHEQPNNGKTIIEKIESFTDVDFAVVLYTYCDDGKGKFSENLNKRARQNVVFEHGYLMSKLGRDKVFALVKDYVETPGDISGVVYTPMDLAGAWKTELAKDIRNSGCKIDLNTIF